MGYVVGRGVSNGDGTGRGEEASFFIERRGGGRQGNLASKG